MHREGFVGAQAEFAAGVGDALGAIGQRKGVGADDRLLGIGRQIEGGELGGGIGRDADAADPRRDEAIAAFEAARKGIGVELARAAGRGRRPSRCGWW